MAIIPNFYIGDYVNVPLTFTVTTPPGPLDITGYVIYFTMKADKKDIDSEAVFQNTLVITDALNGKASLIIQKTSTVNIPEGIYVYDIRTIDAAGNPTVLFSDTIEVIKGVTDAIA